MGKIDSISNLAKGLGDLAKSITGYFNPSAYESRVLRGLVGTGDGMSKWVKKAIDKCEDKTIKRYLTHYSKKWDADRSKLR